MIELNTFRDSGFDWEVIVVDDASPDGTQEIAKQLAQVYGDDRIVCPMSTHHQQGLIISKVLKPRAGKLGLGYAHSDWLISSCQPTAAGPPTSTVWSFAPEIL